jgi:phosphoribosylformylglycinamidine (FGAM) synthase PurS component
MAGERPTPPGQIFKSEVMVTPTVFDPQAQADLRMVQTRGFSQITGLERSKRFEITHEAESLDEAFSAAIRAANNPLANQVVERVKSVATQTTAFPIMKVRINYKNADTSS